MAPKGETPAPDFEVEAKTLNKEIDERVAGYYRAIGEITDEIEEQIPRSGSLPELQLDVEIQSPGRGLTRIEGSTVLTVTFNGLQGYGDDYDYSIKYGSYRFTVKNGEITYEFAAHPYLDTDDEEQSQTKKQFEDKMKEISLDLGPYLQRIANKLEELLSEVE